MLDHGRVLELLVKEALHIQMTPSEERFNRDGGLEIQGRGEKQFLDPGSNGLYPQYIVYGHSVVCISSQKSVYLQLHAVALFPGLPTIQF